MAKASTPPKIPESQHKHLGIPYSDDDLRKALRLFFLEEKYTLPPAAIARTMINSFAESIRTSSERRLTKLSKERVAKLARHWLENEWGVQDYV